MVMMVSQSVKWGIFYAPNDIDGYKKVIGIYRIVLVDRNGFLIAVLVTVASMLDSKGAGFWILVFYNLCLSMMLIWGDGGYCGQLAVNIRDAFGCVLRVFICGYKKTGFLTYYGWMGHRKIFCLVG